MHLYPAIIATLFGLSGALHAEIGTFITSPGTGPLDTAAKGYTLGALFRVSSLKPLRLTSLGIFDAGSPGLAQSHSVALWTASGTLVARVDFSPGLSGLSADGFLYQSLSSPVILQFNEQYVIGANYPVGSLDGLHANDNSQTETWSDSVAFMNGRYTAEGAGFTFPGFDVHGLSYVGPNAQFSVVPEPGTLAFLVCPALALVFRRAPLHIPPPPHRLSHVVRPLAFRLLRSPIIADSHELWVPQNASTGPLRKFYLRNHTWL